MHALQRALGELRNINSHGDTSSTTSDYSTAPNTPAASSQHQHRRMNSCTSDYNSSSPRSVDLQATQFVIGNAIPRPWSPVSQTSRFMPFRVYHSPRPLRRGISAENVYPPNNENSAQNQLPFHHSVKPPQSKQQKVGII